MTGEIMFFRKRFFGGFNRKDVVKYIAMLAEERNELAAAKDKAENDAKALAREVAALRLEKDEAVRLINEDIERKSSVFETAGNTIREFQTVFGELSEEIKAAAEEVRNELKNAEVTVDKLPEALEQTGSRLDELKAAFDEVNE